MTQTMDREPSPPSYTPVSEDSAILEDIENAMPRENTNKPINVLIVGESQQGKSTLVKQLYRYAGVANVDVPIGYGNVRCTTQVNRYEIPVTLRQYRLVDPQGTELKDLSYTDYCDLAEDEAEVVPVLEEHEASIKFMMVDTPGLDDSEGDDFDIMASIVGTVGSMDHINAIVYVRSIGKPFSASFKQFFGYIQRCMPALSNGLIVINTNFTVDGNEQYVSQRQNLAKVRREAFMAATGLDLPHFFMDNEPSRDQPFAVLQSLNETYRLLTYLSSQLPLASTGLKLLKTAHMQNFDVHIMNALLELKNALEKEWAVEQSHASALQQTVMMDQRQIAKIRRRLGLKREQVRELSNGADIHLGSKSCIENYSLVGHFLLRGELNLGKRRMEFDANCEITRVTKTCSGGSKWLDEDLRGTSWRAVLTSNLFRDINGAATFYTTSEVKHRPEIRALHAAIAELEESLEDLEDASVGRGQESGKAKALGESIEGLAHVIHMIKMDTFAIEIWPKVRSLYLSGRRPSKQDVEIFVSAFDENVAKLSCSAIHQKSNKVCLGGSVR